MVVEKLEELFQILQVSREVGVEPLIGLRVRLQARAPENGPPAEAKTRSSAFPPRTWCAPARRSSARAWRIACKLIHFHVGSQVPDIGTIKRAVREAARFYAKMAKMGHALGYIDVGGGLGVDYDGSRTAFDSSTNYSLKSMRRTSSITSWMCATPKKLPIPIIISESGRAIVAHHSMLVVEAFGSIEKKTAPIQLEVKASEIQSLWARFATSRRPFPMQNRHGEPARRPADQGAGAIDVRPRAARPGEQGEDRDGLLAASRNRSSITTCEASLRSGRSQGPRDLA